MKPDIKWLRELPVHSKFSIIIALMMFILLFGLINFWFGLKIMSAVRSYVGGEGLWSKAQKEAVNNLIKYTSSYDEADYDSYLKFLQVTLGDKQARLELNKDDPNIEIARQGFIKGGNNPEDVGDLIFLYKWFKNISYMKIAIDDWTQGDEGIEKLVETGEKIHSVISAGAYQTDEQRITALKPLIGEVYVIDKNLTILENHFSATLSEGSRRIRDILFLVTVALTFLLGSTALLISAYIGKIIEEVDRLKSEFVSMASHELKTPMAAIKGFVAMILGDRYGKLNPELRKPLENISTSMERLIKLSNDLLDVSRIESRGLKPKITDCSTTDLINEVVGTLMHIASFSGTKILIGELDNHTVEADPDYVRQILNNLIGNAIKFAGNGRVDISSRVLDGKQLIYVSDTGIGISYQDQKKIFLKFQQLTSGEDGRPQGSGLGLYISRELAKKMRGNLSLEKSETGQGSVFVLNLPLSLQKKMEVNEANRM